MFALVEHLCLTGDDAWLKAKYNDSWAEMLVFSSQGSADNFLGLNLPAGDTLTGIAIVPEPASLGLLALGAMGLLGRKRK